MHLGAIHEVTRRDRCRTDTNIPSSLRVWIAIVISLAVLTFPFRATAATPNIILITLDTVRADRMGFLGSQRGLTPTLDALAKHSIVFTRAYSQVPLTTSSHATILTGTFPEFHGVNDFGEPLLAEVPYLPALLHRHGYRTAAFVGSLVLDPVGGMAPGFDRGFDTYDAGFRKHKPGEDRFQTVERRGAEVVEHALRWLGEHPAGPFFLWVHLYDGHDPYDPPPPYSVRFANSPYDGAIAYLDSCVGKLLTELRARNLYNSATIIVMADHGESLGQHGEETHGVFLYDETIHVPLVLKLPQDRSAKKRIGSRVGLVDVAPTLLEVAGIAVPSSVQGESLVGMIEQAPALRGRRDANASAGSPQTPPVERPVYAETDYPSRAFGWSALRSLRVGKYLFIQAPRRELYDEAADPEALHNLADVSPAISDTLAAGLREFRRKLSGTRAPGGPTDLDAEQVERLGSLGYVAGGSAGGDAATQEEGADPKDKIEIANLMHDALQEVADGHYEEAVPQLEQVLARQPEMPVAQLQLGIAFSRLKTFEKALPLLKMAVKQQADDSSFHPSMSFLFSAHYELGVALFATGDPQGAIPEFEFTVAHVPRSAEAHYSLAAAYARVDRVPEAMMELHTVLELNPEHYSGNLLRGRILSLQGHADEALPNLEKAAEVEPSSVDAHLFLADAYDQMDQQAKAQRERAIADRLKVSVRP